MDWGALVQLGALGVIAVMMIVKDSKRDAFFQQLITEMRNTVDKNTEALTELRAEIQRREKQ